MSQRVTDQMVTQQLDRVTRLLKSLGVEGTPQLYGGNSTYKESNLLLLNRHNFWTSAMAGYSKKDAYNALSVMESALTEVLGAREDQRIDFRAWSILWSALIDSRLSGKTSKADCAYAEDALGMKPRQDSSHDPA